MPAPPVPVPAPPRPPVDVELVEVRDGVGAMLRSAWRDRRLIPRIGVRIIVKGYAGTRLGRPWLLLRPALNIFALSLLFGAVLDTPTGGVPYVLFLLVGMLPWTAFEVFVIWSTRSFDTSRRFWANFRFPFLLVPTAAVVPALINASVFAGFALGAAAVFTVLEGEPYLRIGPGLLLAAAGLALILLLAWGIGLWLSVLNMHARDVRLVLRFVLTLWLYATPVIYPVSALPAALELAARLNPATAPIELVKEGLLGVGTIQPVAVLVSVAATLVLCAGGLVFFARRSHTILTASVVAQDDE